MRKEEILFNVVYDLTGVSKEDIAREVRLRRISDPRRMVAYVLHKKLEYGSEHTGEIMSRDHATVLYLCKSHELLMETNPDYKDAYNKIYSEFYYRCNHVKYEPSLDEMIDIIIADNDKLKNQIIKLKRLINEKTNTKKLV